jgi:putative colanic acid biosynthesis acetyltransferase WcaF
MSRDPAEVAPIELASPERRELTDDEARHRSPYATREKVARLVWAFVQRTFFRSSFPTWYRYRNVILRVFGARIHPTCRIRRSARFECPWNFTAGRHCSVGDHAIIYSLGKITLGDRVSITQYSHLCAGTHDFSKCDLPLIRAPITIEDDAWLGADSFVGPRTTLHEGALLGARASAFKDLDAWTVYGGNPARPIRPRPRPQ